MLVCGPFINASGTESDLGMGNGVAARWGMGCPPTLSRSVGRWGETE